MIGIAAILSPLQVDEIVEWVLAISFIISGYSFCIALTIEPFIGDKGLSWSGIWFNKIVFGGNITGALSSLVGSSILVYSSYLSL